MNSNAYELLYMSRMCDEWAQKALFLQSRQMQKTMIQIIISRFRPYKIYEDDMLQESDLALIYALENYREDQKCSFKTFLSLLTKRRIWTALRHYSTDSLVQMHDTLTLHAQVSEDEPYYETFEQKDPLNNPEYRMHYSDAASRLQRTIETLSSEEKQILDFWITEQPYQAACRSMNVSYKAYDGKLQRIRKKIRSAVFDSDTCRLNA